MKHLKTKYKIFESKINDIIERCKVYNIKKYEIDDNGLLSVYDDVYMGKLILKKLPLCFKEIDGYFDISHSKIETLKGSPETIHGFFAFNDTCINNLKYCPDVIYGDLYGAYNKKLKHFIEFPNYIGGGIYLYKCCLKSLYGCNDHVCDDFIVCGNGSLYSIKYSPKHVDGSYGCSSCNLVSLYGAPKHVGVNFRCNNNKLNFLKYCPRRVGGDFIFSNNNIRSFEYFPEYVGGDIYCENTPVYEIWKLFEDKGQIEYFNQMKIIKNDTVNIKRLNLFLKSIGKKPVENVNGCVNI